MHSQEMLSRVRNLIRESTAAQWTDVQLYHYLNTAHTKLAELIANSNASYFIRSHTFNMTSGTDTYALPSLFVNAIKLQRIDGTVPQEVLPISQDEEWQHFATVTRGSSFSVNQRYLLEANNLRIVPSPQDTVTNAFRLRYVKLQPLLHTGTAAAVASTSLTFPASPTAGDITAIDDAYEGLSLYIVSATLGAGQQRAVTDYVADTRVCTVAAWNPTPTGTVVYALIPEAPPQWHDWIVYDAALQALSAVQDDPSGVLALLSAQEQSIKSALMRRQQQRPRRIRVLDPW